MNPVLHSPVAGVVTNAGEGDVGRIAIRDANGLSHEILHTHTQSVKKGDLVGVGAPIGTMGNRGVVHANVEDGPPHVHYQLKDRAGRVVNPTEFWNRLDPGKDDPGQPAFLDQSQRAAEIISADNAGGASRISSSDTAAQSFFSPFSKVSGYSAPNPVAERFGRWGSVPLPNMPVASDDPVNFADRFGNWELRAPGTFGHVDAPAPQIAPDPGKRSEADDDAPVRVLSRVGLSPAPLSVDAPSLSPASPPPLLGIFSGKPMRDYPVWPSIFATDDRPSPDDDELYQRWRRFLDA